MPIPSKALERVKIQHHTRIRSDVNPYDPEWEIYFEKRLGLKMANNLRGGSCSICGVNKMAYVRFVVKRLPKSRDGTTTISDGVHMAVQIMPKIAPYCIQIVIDKSIARI